MIPCLLVRMLIPLQKLIQNNDDFIYDSDGLQASTDESYNSKNEVRFSELQQG